MAEYAASEGRGGAAGITAPVALCIVLSRVVSLTTADSRSALASSELRFLLLRHVPVLEYFLDSLPLGTGRLHLQQSYCRMHSLQRLALRDVAFWKSLKPVAAFLKAPT